MQFISKSNYCIKSLSDLYLFNQHQSKFNFYSDSIHHICTSKSVSNNSTNKLSFFINCVLLDNNTTYTKDTVNTSIPDNNKNRIHAEIYARFPLLSYNFNNTSLSNFNYYSTSNYYSNITSSLLTNINLLFESFNNKPTIINSVLFNNYNDIANDTDNTTITDIIDDIIQAEYYAKFPLFFKTKDYIKIPSKVARTIQRHIPRALLYNIHPDINVAIEMCLIFTTQLTSTYFGVKDGTNTEGWKSLHAEYLRELISINPMAYKNVVTALEYPLKNDAILECDHTGIIGSKNFYYRLGQAYLGKGITTYQLTTKEAVRVLNSHYYRRYANATSNIICKNLISLYASLELPTIKQIELEADQLVKNGYVTKKGKILKRLNKHTRDYFKDASKYSFVEDAIEIYNYLTSDGLMIPCEGGINSGGRVFDSFTLMPSWIRGLIEINGKQLIECDYSSLHPNIAMTLYGGTSEYITHKALADELKINDKIVKVEHLSFFNKTIWQMKQSPLYKYYETKEPVMLQNIISEKATNTEYSKKSDKHKITSRKMFTKEVEIMTQVVEQLNSEGIYVLYVYDALLSEPEHASRVLEVMNTIILEHGVKTRAKSSIEVAENTITLSIEVAIIEPKPVVNEPKTDILIVDAKEINFSDIIIDDIAERIDAGEVINFVDAMIRFDDDVMYEDKVLRIDDYRNINLKYVLRSHITNKVVA